MALKDREAYLEYQRQYSLHRRGRSRREKAREPKIVKCACGCGTDILDFDKSHSREIRFARGHNPSKNIKQTIKKPKAIDSQECSCGCGEMIKSTYNYTTGENTKYKHGHNIKNTGERPSDSLIGKRPHNYIDGKGSMQPGRKTTKYSKWRWAVFSRDDFTCQRCNVRGGRLEAHHIKRWSEHKELRFEVSNGETLCYECHKEEHRSRKIK